MAPELIEKISEIHKKINQKYEISLDELLIIKDIISYEKFNSNDYFIVPGDSSLKVGIVIKGLVKTYYINSDGKEHITHFGYEGSIIGVYTDMLKNIPSCGYIQMLEDTELIVMNYENLLQVTKNSLPWAHLLRVIAEEKYVYRSDKDRNMTLRSASEKYSYFLELHPGLENRLPQNQIALYLNLTAATLSRLKNKSGKYSK